MKLTNGIELAPLGLRFTTPVQVLFNASKVFEGFNIKMRSKMTSCPVWLPRQLRDATISEVIAQIPEF